MPDLRKRVLFTLGLLGVYRIGNHIPTPGVNAQALAALANQAKNTMFGMFDLFSGGALSKAASSGWASCPTSARRLSSSCCQWCPLAGSLSKEGDVGRRKITQYTRVTVRSLVASSRALGIAIGSRARRASRTACGLFYSPGGAFAW